MSKSAFRFSDRVNVYLFFRFKIFITPRDVRVSTVMSTLCFLKSFGYCFCHGFWSIKTSCNTHISGAATT